MGKAQPWNIDLCERLPLQILLTPLRIHEEAPVVIPRKATTASLELEALARCGRDLAATLSASAVNAGIAGGSLVGGNILAQSGASAVVLGALGVCAVAVPIAAATSRLRAAAPAGRRESAMLEASRYEDCAGTDSPDRRQWCRASAAGLP